MCWTVMHAHWLYYSMTAYTTLHNRRNRVPCTARYRKLDVYTKTEWIYQIWQMEDWETDRTSHWYIHSVDDWRLDIFVAVYNKTILSSQCKRNQFVITRIIQITNTNQSHISDARRGKEYWGEQIQSSRALVEIIFQTWHNTHKTQPTYSNIISAVHG